MLDGITRGQDLFDAGLDRFAIGSAMDLGALWSFVWVIDAGDMVELAKASPPVDAVLVSRLAHLQRSIDEDFKETADRRPGRLTGLAIGGDRRHHNCDAMPGEAFGDIGNASDILIAILARESEPAAQGLAEGIAVEPLNGSLVTAEVLNETGGDRGFTRRAQPGQPDGHALVLRRERSQIAKAPATVTRAVAGSGIGLVGSFVPA